MALTEDQIGFIDHGRRYLWNDGRVTAIDEDSKTGFDSVLPIPKSLGGGFVFWTKDSLRYASAFEGAPHVLSKESCSLSVLPNALLVWSAAGWRVVGTQGSVPHLVAMQGGAQSGNMPPGIDTVYAHDSGFAVGTFGTRQEAWLTSDGIHWQSLGIDEVQDAVPDGSELLVNGKAGSVLVTRDGSKRTVKLDTQQFTTRRIAAVLHEFRPVGTVAPSESVLWEEGWEVFGQHWDEWFAVRDGQLWIARPGENQIEKIGPRVGEDDLLGIVLGRERVPLVVDMEIGKGLRVERVDLQTGKRVLEKSIAVDGGLVRHVGTCSTCFPMTLFASAACDGQTAGGFCIRDDFGKWITHPAPEPPQGVLLVFPGEVFQWGWRQDSGLVIRGTADRSFGVEGTRVLRKALGTDSATSDSNAAFRGALRTPSGIRLYFLRDPAGERSAHRSVLADLPLNPVDDIQVEEVAGLVAPAGQHALRIDGGNVFESNDAGTTWYEVPPPPTGVPTEDLAASACMRRGCQLRRWVRIGWGRAAPQP